MCFLRLLRVFVPCRQKRADIARVIPCENNFCTKYAHHLHFCGLQKLNTLNLRLFHPPLNPRNHFSTVLIETNWYTMICKYYKCSSLTSINIPNNVTSIGQRAFRSCSKLTSVTILGEGTTIGDNAFVNCIKLGDIYCHSEVVPQTGSDIFSSTANITLHVPNVSIDLYKNTSPWNSFGKIVGLYGSEYELTYILDGAEYKSYTLWEDQSVTPEPAPTKEGHTFSGWSGLPATMPNHDVIVTGAFTINSYTLIYKVDGVVYKTTSVVYGTKPTPEPAPTKEGHTFSGWSGLPETMPAHDVVVTGSFSINSYILTYKVDSEVYKTFTVVYGTTLSPITEPTKTGHTFSGWTGLPATMPAHNVEVTGSFNVNSYTLTYKVDGKVYKTFYVPYGTTITPIEAPIKKGMTFSSWGDVPQTMPAYNVTLTGTYNWSKMTQNKVIYQVTDTLNNFASVVGNNNITGMAEILSAIEIGGDNYEVNKIDNNAFRSCSSLTSVTIPESVTSISSNAFSGCSNLTTVTLNSNSIVSASSSSMKSIFGNQVTRYVLGDNINAIGSNVFYGCNARLYVNRGTDALLSVWNYGVDPYEINTETKLSRPSISATSITQTTITYSIDNNYPEFEYEIEHEEIGENAYLITGLRPSYTQNIPLTVRSANNSYSTSANLTTLPINPTVTSKVTTASSLTVQGSYLEGDARVVSSSVTINGTNMEGVEGKAHGLKPNTSYNCKYTVVVEDNNGNTYPYVGSFNIRTASLIMSTQQPKVINVGNVIVSAESNLDDEETNVGFEWRRTDWTDEFASNTGTAYLYEGKMEGYIRNLYTEKLWKYRPYYESDSGNRYYGEWVGIDPTNTSYFEPTVHTYAQINVTGNRAEVKGYAMRGTDNVQSQGFMYWQNNTSVSLRRRAASVPSGATVVNASGNIMTATLEDLEYEATYNYVAFVTTSEGETFYGEMQTFTTSFDPDGIEDVKSSEEATEVARYDLQGHMIAKPQKGINIIRYSDGTSNKVLLK